MTAHTGIVSTVKEEFILNWLLRASILFCFVGHGSFGIITKSDWLPFFHVVGLSDSLAFTLMPIIGAMDISIGILCFFWPMRFLLVWAAFWCLLTAFMRPLADMSWFEFIERAGNYGIPIVLMMSTCTSKTGLRAWFSKLKPRPLDLSLIKRLTVTLVITTFLLLLGHAGFGIVLGKASLEKHYASVGLISHPGFNIVLMIGYFELALAALVFIPSRAILAAIALWKLMTELLYPISGTLAWETVERAGSYAAPIAIIILIMGRKKLKSRQENAVLVAPMA